MAEITSSENLSNEDIAMLIKNGNTSLYGLLWERCNKLLYKEANKLYGRYKDRFDGAGVTLEDLEQECYFVLLDMVQAYDPAKSFKLLTYTNYQLKNRINRNVFKLGHNNEDRELLNKAVSIDETLAGVKDENITLADTLTDELATEAFETAEERIYQQELRTALSKAFKSRLDERQQAVLFLRFYKGLTYKSIAEEIGCNLSYVPSLEYKAILKLRIAKELKSYKELLEGKRSQYMTDKAYHWTGFGSYRNNQASSQEMILERLEEWRKRNRGDC